MNEKSNKIAYIIIAENISDQMKTTKNENKKKEFQKDDQNEPPKKTINPSETKNFNCILDMQ